MKRYALILLAVACAAVSFAENPKAVRKILDANYKKFAKTFQTKNAKAMLDMMTDDYTVTQPNGQVLTKAQIGKAMTQQMQAFTNSTWVRKITSLKVNGNQAVAQVSGDFNGTLVGGPDNKPHKFRLVATTTDTWIKNGKLYKLQKSVVQKNAVTMDGKPAGG